jgi:hypothetical protein
VRLVTLAPPAPAKGAPKPLETPDLTPNPAVVLERLTEPLDEALADETGGKLVKGLEDVSAALVADGQPPETAEPSQRAFHHPAVPGQPLGTVDAASGDSRLDGAPAQRSSAMREVVAFIGMKCGGSPPRSADAVAYGRHGVDQRLKQLAVVAVGRAEPDGKRNTLGIGDEVALAPGPTAIGRIGAGLLTPLLAGTEALSTQARLQSMALARLKRSSRTRCSLSQVPAACQSRSRRQQLMPDPQPISCGSISQGMPLFSTNRMPVSAARFGSGGRPPFGLGRSGGSNGSMSAHRSSDTRGLAMPPKTAQTCHRSRFC